jgi:hypothetical protein
MNTFQRFCKYFNKSTQEQWLKTPEKRQEVKRQVVELAAIMSGCVFVGQFGFNLTACVGPSMEPTFPTAGSVAIVDVFSHRVLGRNYQYGDVIIAKHPHSDKSKHRSMLMIILSATYTPILNRNMQADSRCSRR